MRGRIAIVLAVGVITPFACSEFQPVAIDEPDASVDGASDAPNAADTSQANDASDASVAVDAADAGLRTIACGDETCELPDEVCCVFFGTQPAPLKFCAVGTCPATAPNDAGYARKITVSCDDPTDCTTPGNVCCAASVTACSLADLSIVECRAPSACPSCEADATGKLGRELCRPNIGSDCPDGSACTGAFTNANLQWSDYRFCK